ncbi:MAG: hypothetical protein K940chlam9_00620 [Chlamydiae bacterium]|nr:hypothetical protein [Chlamydiota bacterium]
MHITFPHLVAPPASKQEEEPSCGKQVERIVTKVFHGCLLLLYAIEYIVAFFMQDFGMRRRIFEGKVLTKTHNHARFSELSSYVATKTSPITLHQDAKEKMKVAGCTPRKKPITLKPIDDGKCFGATTLFAKQALDQESLETLVENFSGGVPIEGAFLQQVYQNEQPLLNNLTLTAKIIDYIETEKQRIHPPDLEELEKALYNAIDAFLAEDRETLEGFTQFVTEKVIETKKTRFTGAMKGTLYHVEEAFTQNVPAAKIREENTYALCELDSECLYYERSSKEVFGAFSHLDVGIYQIGFPTYSPFGNRQEDHIVSLVIRDTGLCYLYDPNCALGWTTRDNLSATMGRLFEEYTGWNFQGESPTKPSFGRKLLNLIQERANPPGILPSSFSLTHLTKHENG